MSNPSFFSGAAFLFFGFCSLILHTGPVADVFRTICLWSVPVLLIALVLDVCSKRYWALAVLVFVVASLGFLALLAHAAVQGVCCG